jgi:uncharacterized membrane-anchored protein YitT (DUF2179 family)
LKKITGFLLINLGLLLTAAGIHFFKVPNRFATGGVSGLAIVLGHFFPTLSTGPIMMIINIVLMSIGFALLGKSFGVLTVYSSFLLSGMVWLFDRLFPLTQPLTNDKLLELFFAIILPAVGSAIVFNQNASTGGTDIVAKVLNKLTSMDIGKALLLSDFLITLAAGAVFGVQIGMYSVLGLIMKGFLIDTVIEGFNSRKQIVVVSSKPEQVRQYIVDNLHRGATIHNAYGAFHNEEKHVITTVVNRRQAVALRQFIRQTDSSAFITITNTSEIIGKGFRSF